MLSGDAEIQRHTHKEGDFVFVSNDLTSEGFHHQPELVRFEHLFDFGKDGAYLEAKATEDGDFYVALQVMDTFGTYDEFFIPITEDQCNPFAETVVELTVNGNFVGRFRYGGDDRSYYLFVTEDVVSIKKGDTIRYTVVKGDGAIFTSIILMKDKPAPQFNEICDITTDNGELRFWTRLASRVSIIFGDESFSENQYLNNHRFTIPKRLWGIRFVIEAVAEDGSILRGRGTVKSKKTEKKENIKYKIQLHSKGKSEEAAPVMSVLPFAKGEVFDLENLSIVDDRGNAYIADGKVTSRWQDESIRTVAITAILPNDGRMFYAQNEVETDFGDTDFTAGKTDNGVFVEANGKSYVFLDTNASVLPDRELYAVLYDENGRKFVAEGGSYEISEAGNNHIIISRENRFVMGGDEHFKAICHIHFYRDISAYSLEFAFENDLMEKEHTSIQGIYLEEQGVAGETSLVYQLDEKTALVDGKHIDERVSGDFCIGEEPVIMKDFWQNYPKSFELAKGELKIGICPFITEPERYRDENIELESRLFFHLKTGKYEFHCGLKKYHTVIFGADAQKLVNIPFLAPDKNVVESSYAFGYITCECTDFPEYDRLMKENLEKYMEHRENYREYGMLNYGDSFGERNIHWTNMEYDFPYGMIIQYLRTGDEQYYWLAQSAVEHFEGIDCSHRNIHFEEDGLYFVHTPGHANNYYPFEMLPTSFQLIKSHVGHLFSHGLYEYYKVSGVERYKEAVLACADSLAKYYARRYDFLTEREPGWALLTLEAAYELTCDPYYLNACRIILERVYVKQEVAGGTVQSLMMIEPEYVEEYGRTCYSGKPFMIGILGNAIKYFYLLTGDERAKQSVLALGRWLADDMYDKETKGFWYTDSYKLVGKHINHPETSNEILDTVLFACIEDCSREYLEMAREAFDHTLKSTFRRECDISKVLSMKLRFAPEIMYDFAQARKLLEKKGE